MVFPIIIMVKTVKARTHYGAESLDITIPVNLVRDLEISEGDIFEVSVDEESEKIKITYERVYDNSG